MKVIMTEAETATCNEIWEAKDKAEQEAVDTVLEWRKVQEAAVKAYNAKRWENAYVMSVKADALWRRYVAKQMKRGIELDKIQTASEEMISKRFVVESARTRKKNGRGRVEVIVDASGKVNLLILPRAEGQIYLLSHTGWIFTPTEFWYVGGGE